MKLALIRHLPTPANRDGLLQGRRDLEILPPSDEALETVARNREALTALGGDFDQVLVSRLRRTAMTAEVYGYGGAATVEPLLDELDFGRFEGKPRKDMLEVVGDAWIEAPQDLVLGEPIRALGERARGMLRKYSHCERLLLFGHAAWSRALMAIVASGELSGMNKTRIDNNQLVILEVSRHASEGVREQ